MKLWAFLLFFQVIVGANAGVVFSHLPRGWAGLVAGTGFVIYGALALWVFWKHSVKFRNFYIFVASFFLFGLSIPMAVARILTPFDRPVTEVLGAPLLYFHKPSFYVFMLMFVMSLGQMVLILVQNQKSQAG